MGKKAKEHRAKVEKRNRKVAQQKYAMQNALNKMMKEMVEKLESLHSDLDRLNTDSNFAYTRMIDALGRIGQKIH